MLRKLFLSSIILTSLLAADDDLVNREKFVYKSYITFTGGLKILLLKNASIMQSKATILDFQALKDQAELTKYPNISLLSFVSPMFHATGDALKVERDYTRWGPLSFTEMRISYPIFTFGQITAARKAAGFGVDAAKNLHKGKINEVIFEYKKLYLSLILLKRLKSILIEGQDQINQAYEKALEQYESGKGKIKKKDVVRLRLFILELKKWQAEWESQKQAATLAMGHFLGRTDRVEIIDTDFPEVKEKSETLTQLIKLGFRDKPEVKALKSALVARKQQLEMEKAGNLPVFFIGAQVQASFTAMTTRQNSIFAFDPFNLVVPAVFIGARWNLDWGGMKSRLTKARGEVAKMEGRKKEALTGIPLKISLAFWNLEKTKKQWRIIQKKYKQASTWSLSEWTSYTAGVGEAKDLLEAFGAFFQIRREMAEAEHNYCLAWSQLALEVGKESMISEWAMRK